MMLKSNPEFCIFTNFDPETGKISYPEWLRRECIIIRICDENEFNYNICHLEQDENYTYVKLDNVQKAVFPGLLIHELSKFDADIYLLSIQARDVRIWFNNAYQFFISTIKEFVSEDDYLELLDLVFAYLQI